MIYSVKIHIDAFNDIQEASEWYEMQLKGLGFVIKPKRKNKSIL
ncbi:hypothetical protein [Flavobacterium sp. M31R6]|nr:hypothetical protein [Flavobacterium sp. M31R6]